MMQLREESLTAIPYSTSQREQTLRIPRVSSLKALRFRLIGEIVLSGGSASGTVIQTPASPFGIITQFRFNMEPQWGRAGSEVVIPPQSLALANVKTLGRVTRRTGLASGAAATHAFDAEWIVPFSAIRAKLFEKLSLFPLHNRSEFTVTVQWPTSDTAARDALLSGNDRTATVTAASTRVEVTMIHVLGDAPAPAYELYYKHLTQNHAVTGENHCVVPLDRFTFVRSLSCISQQAGARSDSILSRIQAWVGSDLVRNMKYGEIQAQNLADYGIAAADWYTGHAILDFDQENDFEDMPALSSIGGELRVVLDTGLTAPSGVSKTEILAELVRWTPRGAELSGVDPALLS